MHEIEINARMAQADSLRRLAADIESGTLPYSPDAVYATWSLYTPDPEFDTDGIQQMYYDRALTIADARQVLRNAPGRWKKSVGDYSISYTRDYGNGVEFVLGLNRSQQCTKVQVGTRTVPAVPAVPEHEEPVYEWDCGSVSEGIEDDM